MSGLGGVWSFAQIALVQILLVCVVFGGFGGWVAHCINNERQQQNARTKGAEPWFLYPSAKQSFGIGAAGAIAFLFFVIAVGGLTNFQTLTEQLRSIAVSVIAGFGARRLLPRMVGHLERQMEEVKSEAEKASHDAKEAAQEAKVVSERQESSDERLKKTEQTLRETEGRLKSLELSNRLDRAANPKASASHVAEALRQFADARKSKWAEPFVWINAARVQRHHVSYDVAIGTLSDFLATVDGGGLRKDGNYPAAYYNRGCYHWLRFEITQDTADQDRALKDLQSCLDSTPNPLTEIDEMRRDPDLCRLIVLDVFAGLVSKYEPPKS